MRTEGAYRFQRLFDLAITRAEADLARTEVHLGVPGVLLSDMVFSLSLSLSLYAHTHTDTHTI